MSSPDADLTDEERARAAKLIVFVIWYVDEFGDGDSFPMAICLSESEARQDFDRRIREGSNKVLTPGWDGIVLEGPMPLFPKGLTGCPHRTAREVLRRAAQGTPGPVAVPYR